MSSTSTPIDAQQGETTRRRHRTDDVAAAASPGDPNAARLRRLSLLTQNQHIWTRHTLS
jgi:hypothetical protein